MLSKNLLKIEQKCKRPAFVNVRGVIITVSLLVFLFSGAACSSKAAAQYKPDESNARILAAYGAKNLECGVDRQPDFPVFDDATRVSVDNCVLEIVATDCSIWGGAIVSLPMCLSIQLNLK